MRNGSLNPGPIWLACGAILFFAGVIYVLKLAFKAFASLG